ncbi:DUF2249 domain-containing protein [Rufibacter sp. LB8]|uniref:DUF2249 domain-containing protein n=1 Tax=Rufibacter sp. LB8 TaxID=2777781 RepID=UPI00178C39D5|nr:DUF2249 domain-containing protein [Rufibacter sp. LB8]
MELAPATKISVILKANPAALEAIVSINRHFEKLRNPIFRKLLASRVTIADAARIGNCTVEAFFEKLGPLGFTIPTKKVAPDLVKETLTGAFPVLLESLPPSAFTYLDVRESIRTGHDPFLEIMAAVDALPENKALVLINTFEPTPLYKILQKRGVASFAHHKEENLVYTYFWRTSHTDAPEEAAAVFLSDFEKVKKTFKGQLQTLDVREMEMPQPMVSILEALEKLPAHQALLVAHRRVPRYLIPQVQERGFALALQELGPDQVQLLIYKQT